MEPDVVLASGEDGVVVGALSSVELPVDGRLTVVACPVGVPVAGAVVTLAVELPVPAGSVNDTPIRSGELVPVGVGVVGPVVGDTDPEDCADSVDVE